MCAFEVFNGFTLSFLASAAWAGVAKIRQDLQNENTAMTRNEEELDAYNFRCARALLKKQRKNLAILAARLPEYRDYLRIGSHVPLLCEEFWIPAQPVPLPPPNDMVSDDSIQLNTSMLSDETAIREALTHPREVVEISRSIMPVMAGSGGAMAGDYVAAIESIPGERPGAWSDRPSYRLSQVKACEQGQGLVFTRSDYFDYQRTCEVLCYEMALRLWADDFLLTTPSPDDKALTALSKSLVVRNAVGNWCDFSRRHAIAGINNLTILRSDTGHRFLMMKRGTGVRGLERKDNQAIVNEGSGAVASAMGAIHVIPAGEFQPSSSSPSRFREECTIWCTLMREFAEEVLLLPESEAQGVRVFDFENTMPFSVMIDAARANPARWRTYYLGTAVDPLSLKPEIMTVTVVDASELQRMYELLFRTNAYEGSKSAKSQVEKILNGEQVVPEVNSEGTIYAFNVGGEELTSDKLADFVTDPMTLPAAIGCLTLTMRHLEELLQS